jgi:hypothetical protein
MPSSLGGGVRRHSLLVTAVARRQWRASDSTTFGGNLFGDIAQKGQPSATSASLSRIALIVHLIRNPGYLPRSSLHPRCMNHPRNRYLRKQSCPKRVSRAACLCPSLSEALGRAPPRLAAPRGGLLPRLFLGARRMVLLVRAVGWRFGYHSTDRSTNGSWSRAKPPLPVTSHLSPRFWVHSRPRYDASDHRPHQGGQGAGPRHSIIPSRCRHTWIRTPYRIWQEINGQRQEIVAIPYLWLLAILVVDQPLCDIHSISTRHQADHALVLI